MSLTIHVVKQADESVRVSAEIAGRRFGRVCMPPANTADHVAAVMSVLLRPDHASPVLDALGAELGRAPESVAGFYPLIEGDAGAAA